MNWNRFGFYAGILMAVIGFGMMGALIIHGVQKDEAIVGPGTVVNMYGDTWGDETPVYGVVVEYKKWNRHLHRYEFHYFLVEEMGGLRYLDRLNVGDKFDGRGVDGWVTSGQILEAN